jgi:beta-galactosidase
MIQIAERRIEIDGKPRLIFAGEIHYFRLARNEWEDRILKLKDLGANAVASYIPWLVHEEAEGEFDVSGKFRSENDVAAFIDLCHQHGLWFIARPGPYIMAEMKNEGIPYWVYKKYPELVPLTWKGDRARSKTLDYLAPNFLHAADRWYGQIMPILASRLQPKGGPVIAVQLDNEIGMLSWVNNQPDLSDHVLTDFEVWQHRQGLAPIPDIRNPKLEFHGRIHRELGDYYRDRNARYIAKLRTFAEARGVRDVPFLVNIHGTGGGKSATYPIGISQLYRGYTQQPGYLSGSDHYLGELTRENIGDLYLLNAFTACVNRPEQPLTSLEFEVGTGDYGEMGTRQSSASAVMKVQLSIAQGNRLLNYYLLAGGRNPKLRHPVPDGNGRVAFTGERHGFAAPINPEGKTDSHFDALKQATRTILEHESDLATATEEHDNLVIGFFPDAYKTDFHVAGKMETIVRDLEACRSPLDQISRTLLRLGFRYGAVDVQGTELDLKKVLVVAVPRLLDASIQTKLVEFVQAGGKLFMYGDLPVRDNEGKSCTILLDAFGIMGKPPVSGDGDYHPSLTGVDWASGEPEVRTWRAQPFGSIAGTFLKMADTGDSVGAERSLGTGMLSVISAQIPAHLPFFRELLTRLGAKASVQTDDSVAGTVITTMKSASGKRFLCAINLDAEAKTLSVTEEGRPLLSEPLATAGRTSVILPIA